MQKWLRASLPKQAEGKGSRKNTYSALLKLRVESVKGRQNLKGYGMLREAAAKSSGKGCEKATAGKKSYRTRAIKKWLRTWRQKKAANMLETANRENCKQVARSFENTSRTSRHTRTHTISPLRRGLWAKTSWFPTAQGHAQAARTKDKQAFQAFVQCSMSTPHALKSSPVQASSD